MSLFSGMLLIQKINLKCIWLPVLLFAICATMAGQEVRVNAKLDSTRAMIGDQLKMHLNAEVGQGVTVTFPDIGDTLSGKVEVIRKSSIDSTRDPEGKLMLNQDLLIAVFDTGFVTIPRLAFRLKTGDHSDTLHTEPLILQIVSLPLDTTVRDIKANMRMPVSLEETFPFILVFLSLAVLVILIIFLARKFRKKEKIITFNTPAEPAWAIALRQLEKIKNEKSWVDKTVKSYYIELTDVLRHYLEGRFHMAALEQTTDEIVRSLRKTDCGKENIENLGNILSVADLVKFAKVIPDDDENLLHAEEAISFVQKTIPVINMAADKEISPVQNNVGS